MAETKYYARPEGGHYHADRNCPMLAGGQFEELGYVEIAMKEAKKRKLRPCACVGLTKGEGQQWVDRIIRLRGRRVATEGEMRRNMSKALKEGLLEAKFYKPSGEEDILLGEIHKLTLEQKDNLLSYLYGAMGDDPMFIQMLKKGIKLEQDVHNHVGKAIAGLEKEKKDCISHTEI
jgi:hypothetical protein